MRLSGYLMSIPDIFDSFSYSFFALSALYFISLAYFRPRYPLHILWIVITDKSIRLNYFMYFRVK